ncbi:helix-turn-helix domain-containing protein, partial [Escherichia coli]
RALVIFIPIVPSLGVHNGVQNANLLSRIDNHRFIKIIINREWNMDQIAAMRVFIKVVEHQSFTRAAAQLGISVAMTSKLMQQL